METWQANIILRSLGYKLFRWIGTPKLMPLSIAFDVTNVCNSRCKTCNVWKLYQKDPDLREKEFATWEFERFFEILGQKLVWITYCGGEPYLRRDFVQICEACYEFCRPKIVIIATNGLLDSKIARDTRKIVETCSDSSVIVNLSLDGIGEQHDDLRGVPGNFQKVMSTFNLLKEAKKEFSNLEVGLHSVVSKFNIDQLTALYSFVHALNPDSYICEYAENRSELFNKNSDIAPPLMKYEVFLRDLSSKVKRDYLEKSAGIPKLIQAFRLTYYDFVLRVLKERRQVLPCYAGFISCGISPYGDVWPCAIRAYDAILGNLRQADYNLERVWKSPRADIVRETIKLGQCYCPLANAYYTNALCNSSAMLKILPQILLLR